MEFDLNLARSILTLMLFLSFVALCVLVIIQDKRAYDDASDIPFKEPDNND